MDHSSTKEPFVAYNKLNNGILEISATAFGDEVTSENIMFLHKVTSHFRIHSVVLKWFRFDEKMLRIFDIFDEKLQKSVKSVAFEKCYFPEAFVFKGSLELTRVTNCFYNTCFANEESFREMFKIFKNAPVTSLTLSRVLDCNQHNSIDTSIALKSISTWNAKKRSMKINDLELDSFFPNITFLSLSYSSLDFDHSSLTSLKMLNSVDLNLDFENLCNAKFFERLPTNLKHVKLFNSDYYRNLNFIESAFDKKIIIDIDFSSKYNAIDCVKTLSVFSSLNFDMDSINDKMFAIKEYVDGNGGAINTVTSVEFDMVFNYQSIVNMITLLTYFPNLDNLEVLFSDDCDASINDDEVRQLFSALPIRNVKKLSIYFEQEEETTAFYCFIVELMKLCQNITSLKFYYSSSNSFAINIKEMVERENIQFTDLDTLMVEYNSDYIDVSIDLFYVAKYDIKNLSMEMFDSIQNLDELDQFDCFSVDNLSIKLEFSSDFEIFINKFVTKFPHVTDLNWFSYCKYLISTNFLQYMKRLKNVTVNDIFYVEDFVIFLALLPLDLESLEIKCLSNNVEKMEEIEKVFYERFPLSTLTLNVL